MRWPAATAWVAIAAACGAGCGGDGRAAGERTRLVVSAAASVAAPLSSCSQSFEGAEVRLSFAGSDQLAAQIRRGFAPDVYAAANAGLPARLHEEGLLDRPLRFATNRLVVALPAGSPLRSVRDLARDRTVVAIGSEAVPIGAYTREALARLPRDVRQAVLANVRSREPDVRGIVGKLAQGAADAGFLYETDVEASRGRLKALALPRELRRPVVYAAGVVSASRDRATARRYVNGLAGGECRKALAAAGFGIPR